MKVAPSIRRSSVHDCAHLEAVPEDDAQVGDNSWAPRAHWPGGAIQRCAAHKLRNFQAKATGAAVRRTDCG